MYDCVMQACMQGLQHDTGNSLYVVYAYNARTAAFCGVLHIVRDVYTNA